MATATPATVFTWRISTLEREVADGYVFVAHYTVDASDGTYNAGAYGSIGLERPAEGDEMVPFANLTEELVVSWVKQKLGNEAVTNVESALQIQLDEQRTPTKQAGVPWS